MRPSADRRRERRPRYTLRRRGRLAATLVILTVVSVGLLGFAPRLPALAGWYVGAPFRWMVEAVALHWPWAPPVVKVPPIACTTDKDGDGLPDLDDFVQGARQEAGRHTIYRDGYYNGGYPPEGVGVCTDVVWRAFKNAGFDLKSMVDKDIAVALAAYPRVTGKPEPNIDFRRVPNLVSFFERNAAKLTAEVIPGNVDNLAQWQRGDIVIFGNKMEHIGIISDRRRRDGVPFIIHNAGPFAAEEDRLLSLPWPVTGHYRFPK